MNIALIFAGGTGQRMKTASSPKQFLEVHGKPIIVYTLEKFSVHEQIDAIVVVCVSSHIDHLLSLIRKFNIQKVVRIVPGGASGQESIYEGLKAIQETYQNDSIVLIHDGVRPFIDADVITRNIETARTLGNAITVTPSIETIVIKNDQQQIERVVDRSVSYHAKAPQTFVLGDIMQVHNKARIEGYDKAIDSASLMAHYGHDLHIVEGNMSNIKITTPQDFYFMRALIDIEENKQLELL